jgi:hypothetical protein
MSSRGATKEYHRPNDREEKAGDNLELSDDDDDDDDDEESGRRCCNPQLDVWLVACDGSEMRSCETPALVALLTKDAEPVRIPSPSQPQTQDLME